ncbi:PHD and RING finger domain-containing protein 1-like [Rhynchophorus ferrugineus]|uniref:PHD and RING finger domain-containing protein 1-like n=1 Tax=Rhynchophorus ferrugineus TaxID=354439 RepID=UPI003FCCC619
MSLTSDLDHDENYDVKADLLIPSTSSQNSSLDSAALSNHDEEIDLALDEKERCPICLKILDSQTLSTPDTCSLHTFCLTCLEEWSKVKNTCPVDRKEYRSILVLNSDREILNQIPIKSFSQENNENIPAIVDEMNRFLCVYCLSPLDLFPTGVFFCNDCCLVITT